MWQLCVSILLAGSSVVVLAEPINYTDCGSTADEVTEVDITECPVWPCYLVRGTTLTVQVKFTPSVQATSLRVVVHTIIRGVVVPWPLFPDDGCDGQSLFLCPLEAGMPYVYRKILDFDYTNLEGRAGLKFEIFDQNNDAVVCFQLPATNAD